MRLYGSGEMVRAGCHDCRGCSACCRGMGDTIVLDPLDIYRLTGCLNEGFEGLLASCVGLHVEDGLLLPHLRMREETESCFFLNEEGRCAIHAFRPGLCRTFPLGRNYDNGELTYFVVEGECPQKNRSKVKVEKWIDTPDFEKNQAFLIRWHYFVKELRWRAAQMGEEERKSENLRYLQLFYLMPYDRERDFYSQFEERLGNGGKHEQSNFDHR